jgi:Ca-activated chloride channel family protein
VVLEQTFENPHSETLHVTYKMPLPADGAVSGYAFTIGERTITGKVDKKQAAREQFERAVAEGKTAALLEQNRDDIFTQEIGNLPARATLVAKITVDQRLAWLPEGEWELRFPTVIGPRYVGGPDNTEQDARDVAIEVAPDGVSARIALEVSIRDTIVPGRRASSPSHSIEKDADGLVVLGTDAALDRDIVVRWPVATREVGLSLDVARPHGSDDSYGLLSIVPPAAAARAAALPRDLIILLDTSGSMSGGPLDKAKHVVSLLIESLGEADRLELIEFSNSARRYKKEPIAATPAAKREAIAWVKKLSADGSTEMASAVREALHALRPGAQRQVVLVTDGYVGGEQQIVKQLHENLPKSCRMHVLGMGSAVNRSLATALARAGRGAEVLVGLDEDIERGAKRLLDRTRMPVLTNVEISGDALVRHAPEHVPDVFEGAPVVAALALSPLGGELVVRGELAAAEPGHPFRVAPEAWIQKIRVPAKSKGEGNPAIAALYAREHVADLETRWTIGDNQPGIDREIEDTGVQFQISTRLTSWVAIDELRRVDGPARHEVMPQALPYGTNAAAFGLRPAGMPMALMPTGGYAMAPAAAPMLAQPTMKTMAFSMADEDVPMLRGGLSAPSTMPVYKRSRRGLVFFLFLLALIAAFLVWWLVL